MSQGPRTCARIWSYSRWWTWMRQFLLSCAETCLYALIWDDYCVWQDHARCSMYMRTEMDSDKCTYCVGIWAGSYGNKTMWITWVAFCQDFQELHVDHLAAFLSKFPKAPNRWLCRYFLHHYFYKIMRTGQLTKIASNHISTRSKKMFQISK